MFNTLQQEKEIVKRLTEGDQGAFEKIYQLYSPSLYHRLLRLLKSVPPTEEILQEVFIKIWEYRASIDPEKSFRAFLFKIAENKVYDFFRKASRDQKFKADFIVITINHDLVLKEFMNEDGKSARLENAIESLPPQRRQVFRLIKLERRSYKEVSEFLGISISTISDHVVKATKSIRVNLKNYSSVLLNRVSVLWLIAYISQNF
jgi:RNA polymerase sigma-70 factor (family 1)